MKKVKKELVRVDKVKVKVYDEYVDEVELKKTFINIYETVLNKVELYVKGSGGEYFEFDIDRDEVLLREIFRTIMDLLDEMLLSVRDVIINSDVFFYNPDFSDEYNETWKVQKRKEIILNLRKTLSCEGSVVYNDVKIDIRVEFVDTNLKCIVNDDLWWDEDMIEYRLSNGDIVINLIISVSKN